MERYYKRKSESELSTPPKRDSKKTSAELNLEDHPTAPDPMLLIPISKYDPVADHQVVTTCSRNTCVVGFNSADLPTDPALRIPISEYAPDIRDEVRRAYLKKGPCQPRNHSFPFKNFGKNYANSRRFNPAWFSEYPNWLEYSVTKDAAFCLCCYLFKPNNGKQAGGDVFVGEGFSNWKKKERLQKHVGGENSAHNQAWNNCEALLDEYRTILDDVSLDTLRLLLRQGLPIHGQLENEGNDGNFLELLQLLYNIHEDVKPVRLETALENSKSITLDVQKEIVSVISDEIVSTIARGIGDRLFSILFDDSNLHSEDKISAVFRYVDDGNVVERFVLIDHVAKITAFSLKTSVDKFFSKYGLCMSRLRGQGYDGESNCRGELHRLKSLIVKENECAFYVHCFANKLQSILVSVGREQFEIYNLFKTVAILVDIVGAAATCYATLRERDVVVAFEELKNNGFLYETKNKVFAFEGDSSQETTLIWSSDACEDSHYNTLSNLITMFASVVDVLDVIERDGYRSDHKGNAYTVLESIFSFGFALSLHLMKTILEITSDLSAALQRGDQDLVTSMKLVKPCKEQLQMMRDNGWNSLFKQVCSFCEEHQIQIPNMADIVPRQVRYRSKNDTQEITNMHYYQVELFQSVLNNLLQELNNRFTETDTELLLCIACLNPSDSFSAFNKQQLIHLAQFYPQDFSAAEVMTLADQLESYISEVRSDVRFSELTGIAVLAQKMVETEKDKVYNLVYLLMTLALILPVATATEKRVFSSINRVKIKIETDLEDEWMSDRLIPYIESDILNSLDNETIVRQVENLKLGKRSVVAIN